MTATVSYCLPVPDTFYNNSKEEQRIHHENKIYEIQRTRDE